MRPEKQAMVEEMERRLGGGSYVILANYQGLKVDEFQELRSRLREAGAELHVVKNRLFKRLADAHGWGGMGPLLRGPSAMVTGGEVTQAAKRLKKFIVENKSRPALKGGALGGRVLAAADIEALASLPDRETLLAMAVGTVAAPLSRLVGVMGQKLCSLVYVLKAVQAKKSA